jgi:phosphate transport system permease protein
MPSQFNTQSRSLFGIRRRTWVKGFFGGNAGVAFAVIFLITIFLVSEAVRFFPAHHEELRKARRSGQEYVDYLIREADWSQEMVSLTNQAYFQELDFRFGVQRGLVEGFEGFLELVEERAEEEIDRLADARNSGDEEGVREAEARYFRKVAELVSSARPSDLDPFGRLQDRDREWGQLRDAALSHDPLDPEVPASIQRAEEEMTAGMQDFRKAKAEIVAARRPLASLRNRLVDLAAQIREKIPEDDSSLAAALEPILNAHQDHVAAVAELQSGITRALSLLPDEPSSPAAAALVERIRDLEPSLREKLAVSVAQSSDWNWREEVGWYRAVTEFFLGTEWKAGSDWRQVFGLLPLLTGSLLVSVMAMTVAVPLSIGAAIYVNQLSSRREQMLIKPAIEMIQAIPTVVLGFFGIMVLGDLLVEWSASPLLSWLPGFPVTERLNLLNAGLLLSLMAIPTIFTLCEDALNHVPRSYTEASMALGASRIDTVARVVVPAAVSGIIAAVLLGFGRVIGETMVALLVAGNRVAMPDWSLGPGVITQPGHTMTGVIADEMGRVGPETLHYRALFLLGLVLFVISLGVNLGARFFVKRLIPHG